MKKILIVDDRTEIRELVEVTLRIGDYNIMMATSGKEAVKIAKSEKPDLIIMDIMMPGEINGLEATKIIKSDANTKNCKIVILSAKGQKIDVETGNKAGADDYFIKPFDPIELMEMVEDVLG